MGRKRIHKQKSPIKSKKTKSSSVTIESLFRRTDQSNDGSNLSSTSEQKATDCEIVINKANICGETDIDSMIELIDEWVNTEEMILDEDIAYINKFFIDLSSERDKEKIKTIVDHFYESISKRDESDSEDWRSMYNDVIGLISSDFEELNFDFF